MADESDKSQAIAPHVQVLTTRRTPRGGNHTNRRGYNGPVPRFESLDDCKRHLARMYRDGKNGALSANEVNACVNAINSIAKILKDVEGEKRMEKIEQQLALLLGMRQTAQQPAKEPEPAERKD